MKLPRLVRRSDTSLATSFAAMFLVSAAVLAWLGYHAVSEWQDSAEQSAEYRGAAAADLLVVALTRDMRALQSVVLPSMHGGHVGWDESDVLRKAASAFAKYPYPNVFFAWEGSDPNPSDVAFYMRSERPPAWAPSFDVDRFPVVAVSARETAQRLLERLRRDQESRRMLSVFDLNLRGVPHQVVASVTYADPLRKEPREVRGFMVDLAWVRAGYFPRVLEEILRMEQSGGQVDLAIIDERQHLVSGRIREHAVVIERPFPLLFFDPIAVSISAPPDLDRLSWRVQASASGDALLQAAHVGARRAWVFGAAVTVLLGVGFVLTLQGLQAKAQLTAMRADFVSSVTHALKTPIATISAIGETFATGRGVTPELSRTYGRRAFVEASRLARLVDNLLAYARIADITEAYTFETVHPRVLIDDALKDFASQFEQGGFEVEVDAPSDLPVVRADRRAVRLMIGNLIDNAIRYSGSQRRVRMTASPVDGHVSFAITDQGLGIDDRDLQNVTKRFYRGSNRVSGGTGLGLAIVEQIVRDHNGSLAIRSVLNEGTTVSFTLPSTVPS